MENTMSTNGSRASVYHGNAIQTTGGLRKKDLYKNKRGRIVSRRKSKTAKNWNPLKMMGLLSKSGEAFGARTFGKGTMSRTQLGNSGQRVLDFMTHKRSRVKRNGKKYKAYYSRKGSKRKRNKFKVSRNYSQSGGLQPITYSNYPSAVPDFSSGTGDAFTSNPQIRALQAGAGKGYGGGLQPLQMASLNDANSTQMANNSYGINSPLGRALTAAA